MDLSFHLSGNTNIWAEATIPDNPKCGVVLAHGLGEHFGRYIHVVEAFAAAGIATFGYDHTGHGRSSGKRGHVSSYQVFMDEIEGYVSFIREEFPDLPLFLYGHSLGGNIALHYLATHHHEFDGAIISAPYIRLAFQPPSYLVAFAKLASSIIPAHTQSNQLELEALSRDDSVIQAYVNDPLVHQKISTKMASELFKSGAFLDTFKGDLNTEVLLMHGSSDRINDVEASREFARRVDSAIDFQEWIGFYHELHNEPEKTAVIEFVIDWINTRLKKLN